MPNTPALVGEGVSAICGSAQCTEADLAWAESLLKAVGIVVRVDEAHMDVVTAVAGSGPGYLFLIAESLLDAARAEGLPDGIADVLVRQLFKGAGILLAESTESPATLRERVTSPNGTTAAGLGVLETSGIRETMHNVVKAAAARSVEMGK
jgi:pyrroline-5-carboxylate reductase